MEYVIWGIPPHKDEEDLLITMFEGERITDIDIADWLASQLTKNHGCTEVRIQTIDLTAGVNQLFIDAINQ